MNRFILLLLLPAATFFNGCLGVPPPSPPTTPAQAGEPSARKKPLSDTDRLKAARVLLDEQENRDAANAYLEIKESTANRDTKLDAAFGAAVALQRLKKIPAAIGVLMPPPLIASTPREARHLALLGELYLRARALGTARHWLQVALECPSLPTATWVAVARFNLGKCLISLDAPAEAIAAFDAAEQDFAALGNITAAELCTSAVRQLESIDRLSAPHRYPMPSQKKRPATSAAPELYRGALPEAQ